MVMNCIVDGVRKKKKNYKAKRVQTKQVRFQI